MSTTADGRAAPPGSGTVVLPAAIRDALVAHALAQSPIEMCGFVVGSAAPAEGGIPLRWEPARNAAASPLRFDIAPEDLVRITLDVDDRGEAIWAVVHSHVRSPAVPSATDLAGAGHAGALHILVSLAAGDAEAALGAAAAAGSPSVRAWRIADGEAREVALAVEP